MNPITKQHIEMKDGKKMLGTIQYVSLNTHLGIEQSRRDDMESIGYMLIYLAKGLPWKSIKDKDIDIQCEKIKQSKEKIPIKELCEGLPKQFETYITYCKNLNFTDSPKYDYLIQLFRDALNDNGLIRDYRFDWISEDENDIIILSDSNSDAENKQEDRPKHEDEKGDKRNVMLNLNLGNK